MYLLLLLFLLQLLLLLFIYIITAPPTKVEAACKGAMVAITPVRPPRNSHKERITLQTDTPLFLSVTLLFVL